MALWKPFRGSRADLDVVAKHDGYVYFCDDGTLHFDHTDADGILKRTQINAANAETLCGQTLEEIKASIGGGSIGTVVDIGDIQIDGENYSIKNTINSNNNIYLGDDIIQMQGDGIDICGNTSIVANGRVHLSSDNDGSSYVEVNSAEEDNKYVDIGSSKVTIHGKDSIGLYADEEDKTYIEMQGGNEWEEGYVNLKAENLHFDSSSLNFGSIKAERYADDPTIHFMFNGGDAGTIMGYDEDGNSFVDIYGDKVTVNGSPLGSGGVGGAVGSGKRQVTFDELKEFLQDAPVGQQVQVVSHLGADYEAFTEVGACLALNDQRMLTASKLTADYEAEYPRMVMDEYRINIDVSGSDDYATLTRRYIPFDGGTYEPEVVIETFISGDGSFDFYILGDSVSIAESEKEEMVNDVLARLPVYNGEVL